MLPTQILVNERVDRINAETMRGSRGILPNHIDFVAPLMPGILVYVKNEKEIFLAVDRGVLVKQGDMVHVSVRNAVRGEELGRLQQIIDEQFKQLDERERKARSSMAMLEAGIIRKFNQQEQAANE